MVDVTLLVQRINIGDPDDPDKPQSLRRGDIIEVFRRANVTEPLVESRRDRHFFLHVNNIPAPGFPRIKNVLERHHDDWPDPDSEDEPVTQDRIRLGRRRWHIDMDDLPPPRRAEINNTGETEVNWPTFRDACDLRLPLLRVGFLRKMLDTDVA